MTKIYNLSCLELFDVCIHALQNLNIKVENESKQDGQIQAITSASILSWGEEISIKIHKKDASKSEVYINSSASSQLFTWGKNAANENNIFNEIDKILS